jgi:hypothetical protein
MKDIIIPIGFLLFLALFVYAIIHTGRKQRQAKSNVYRDFARNHGLRYLEIDDGKVQTFAKEFDGIGQFKSPSLGKVIPQDVVFGTKDGLEVILFRHSIRFSEGWAREWFVCGIHNEESIANKCAVQFCKRKTDKSSMYLKDPVVKEYTSEPFRMIVRSSSPANTGKLTQDHTLRQISLLANNLSFRPEIQLYGKNIVCYSGGRNETIDDMKMLVDLFEFTKGTAHIIV